MGDCRGNRGMLAHALNVGASFINNTSHDIDTTENFISEYWYAQVNQVQTQAVLPSLVQHVDACVHPGIQGKPFIEYTVE